MLQNKALRYGRLSIATDAHNFNRLGFYTQTPSCTIEEKTPLSESSSFLCVHTIYINIILMLIIKSSTGDMWSMVKWNTIGFLSISYDRSMHYHVLFLRTLCIIVARQVQSTQNCSIAPQLFALSLSLSIFFFFPFNRSSAITRSFVQFLSHNPFDVDVHFRYLQFLVLFKVSRAE